MVSFIKRLYQQKHLRLFVTGCYRLIKTVLLWVSPVLGSKFIYRVSLGDKLNLRNPKTFNEKIQWLKLYRYPHDLLVAQCTDKAAVRDYVSAQGLGHLLNDVYGIFHRAEEIDWGSLPDSFVAKTTHGCGGNIICPSKQRLDTVKAVAQLNRSLKMDYSKVSAELHYANITPRIIVEKYLRDGSRKMPIDYKVYCFHGKAELFLVISDRDTSIRLDFISLEWERLKIGQEIFESPEIPHKPLSLHHMIQYAETLAQPFPFVRVDFYEIDSQPVFGEMTFTPASGVATYYNQYGQTFLGGLLQLAENKVHLQIQKR